MKKSDDTSLTDEVGRERERGRGRHTPYLKQCYAIESNKESRIERNCRTELTGCGQRTNELNREKERRTERKREREREREKHCDGRCASSHTLSLRPLCLKRAVPTHNPRSPL